MCVGVFMTCDTRKQMVTLTTSRASSILTSDVNVAEPKMLVIDVEQRLSFSDKNRARAEPSQDSNKMSQRRVDTLGNLMNKSEPYHVI